MAETKLTINNSAKQLHEAMQREHARRNSGEAIAAAVAEFERRTGRVIDNQDEADQIANLVEGDITPDSLQRAAEVRDAWRLPKEQLWKLKRKVNGE